jgi:hypothetical protein
LFIEKRVMLKKPKIPLWIKETGFVLFLYFVLCLLWYYLVGDAVVLSDQGLTTIGLALCSSLGGLTAIVISFSLIIWQTSRRDRTESFVRWRNILNQFMEFFDKNIEYFPGLEKNIITLMYGSASVSSISPMSREEFKKLSMPIFDKCEENAKRDMGISDPNKDQIHKAQTEMYLGNYLVLLTHANFDHNLARYLYKRLFELRGLLYRLLIILGFSILLVTFSVIKLSNSISDSLNVPVAFVLVLCVIYILTKIGLNIRKLTKFEDEIDKQEKATIPKPTVPCEYICVICSLTFT